jgi:ABC-type multidrug transport system fused ATPase/permease subunit
MINAIKIWKLLERNDKQRSIILLIITILASIAEMLNIAIIIPFITLLAGETQNQSWYLPNINKNHNLLIIYGSFIAILIVISAYTRHIQMRLQIKISTEIAAKFSTKLFSKILEKELRWHNDKNTSQHISGAEKARMLVSYVLYPTLYIITNTIIGLSILSAIIINSNYYILMPLSIIVICYYMMSLKIKQKSLAESVRFANSQTNLTKCMQDAYGSIRDLKIYKLEDYYKKKYSNIIKNMQEALKNILQFASGPRYIIEAFGTLIFILIIVILYSLIESKFLNFSKSEAAGVIIMMAVGFQRLLPISQGIYSSYTNIQGSKASVNEVLEILLETEKINNESKTIELNGDIRLHCIKFSYDGKKIINNANMLIPKGSIVAIKGASGSGKTTIADIIMGLIQPDSGEIYVGGVKIEKNLINKWQEKISYVSQNVFMTNGTIKENILLGNQLFHSEENYKKSLERADLEYFEKQRMHMKLGERGSKISGGQRQRIGIARAYYKQAKYVILDEPTSSLDKDSEDIIYNFILNKESDETIIIISHSINLLKKVNIIYEINNGILKKVNI